MSDFPVSLNRNVEYVVKSNDYNDYSHLRCNLPSPHTTYSAMTVTTLTTIFNINILTRDSNIKLLRIRRGYFETNPLDDIPTNVVGLENQELSLEDLSAKYRTLKESNKDILKQLSPMINTIPNVDTSHLQSNVLHSQSNDPNTHVRLRIPDNDNPQNILNPLVIDDFTIKSDNDYINNDEYCSNVATLLNRFVWLYNKRVLTKYDALRESFNPQYIGIADNQLNDDTRRIQLQELQYQTMLNNYVRDMQLHLYFEVNSSSAINILSSEPILIYCADYTMQYITGLYDNNLSLTPPRDINPLIQWCFDNIALLVFGKKRWSEIITKCLNETSIVVVPLCANYQIPKDPTTAKINEIDIPISDYPQQYLISRELADNYDRRLILGLLKEESKDPPKEESKDPPKEDNKDPPKEDNKDPPKEESKDPPKPTTKKINVHYRYRVIATPFTSLTPVLYLACNVGSGCYITNNSRTQSRRIVMKLNNSFMGGSVLVYPNGDFTTIVRSNDLSDLEFTLIDAYGYQVQLFSPMFVTIHIDSIADELPPISEYLEGITRGLGKGKGGGGSFHSKLLNQSLTGEEEKVREQPDNELPKLQKQLIEMTAQLQPFEEMQNELDDRLRRREAFKVNIAPLNVRYEDLKQHLEYDIVTEGRSKFVNRRNLCISIPNIISDHEKVLKVLRNVQQEMMAVENKDERESLADRYINIANDKINELKLNHNNNAYTIYIPVRRSSTINKVELFNKHIITLESTLKSKRKELVVIKEERNKYFNNMINDLGLKKEAKEYENVQKQRDTMNKENNANMKRIRELKSTLKDNVELITKLKTSINETKQVITETMLRDSNMNASNIINHINATISVHPELGGRLPMDAELDMNPEDLALLRSYQHPQQLLTININDYLDNIEDDNEDESHEMNSYYENDYFDLYTDSKNENEMISQPPPEDTTLPTITTNDITNDVTNYEGYLDNVPPPPRRGIQLDLIPEGVIEEEEIEEVIEANTDNQAKIPEKVQSNDEEWLL